MNKLLLSLVFTAAVINGTHAQNASVLAERIVALTNEYRQSKGLPALRPNLPAAKEARLHSVNMAEGRVPFGHKGFNQRLEKIRKEIPFNEAAENVGYLSNTEGDIARRALSLWIKSPPHNKNLLGHYTDIGVGVAINPKGEVFLTQVFLNSRAHVFYQDRYPQTTENTTRRLAQATHRTSYNVGKIAVELISSP